MQNDLNSLLPAEKYIVRHVARDDESNLDIDRNLPKNIFFITFFKIKLHFLS